MRCTGCNCHCVHLCLLVVGRRSILTRHPAAFSTDTTFTFPGLETVFTYMLHYWSPRAIHLNWLYLVFGMKTCMFGAWDPLWKLGLFCTGLFLTPLSFMAASNQLFYSLRKALVFTRCFCDVLCLTMRREPTHIVKEPVQTHYCKARTSLCVVFARLHKRFF